MSVSCCLDTATGVSAEKCGEIDCALLVTIRQHPPPFSRVDRSVPTDKYLQCYKSCNLPISYGELKFDYDVGLFTQWNQMEYSSTTVVGLTGTLDYGLLDHVNAIERYNKPC